MSGHRCEARRAEARAERFLPGVLEKLAAYEPPSDFVPLQVEFHLRTPLLMGYPWVFGDALLARLLMEEILEDDFYNLPAKEPLPIWKHLNLPVARNEFRNAELGSAFIYHASASILDTDEKHVVTMYKRFHEAEDLKYRGKIKLSSGKYRSYMLKFPYSASNTVRFNFLGDAKEIIRLMENVRYIGKKRAVGGGEVSHMEVHQLQKDESIVRAGVAMRSIPVAMLKEIADIHVMRMAYRFPAWDGANTCLCVAPGGKCEI